MYDCFDRSDEIPFDKVKESFWFDVTLKSCYDQSGFKGFECTRKNITKCVTDWCSDFHVAVSAETCDEINGRSVKDEKVCGNYTLWQNYPCNYF